ncbi:MAG: T9SS type A sorting domain-containing protein [Flavobacteriales bacterium]
MARLSCFLLLFLIFANGYSQLSSPSVIANPISGQNEMFPMDIDGDGDLDIITTNGGGVNNYLYYNNGYRATEFQAYINDGSGNFSAAPLITLESNSLWDFGDADGDGRLDMLYADSTHIYYLHQLNNITFDVPELVYEVPAGLDCAVLENHGQLFPSEVMRIGIGDMDNDGDGDLVFSAGTMLCANDNLAYPQEQRLYSIKRNVNSFDEPNFFSDPFYLANSNNAGGINIMDVNEDGLNDIVHLQGPDIGFWEMIIYFGTDDPAVFEPSPGSSADEIVFQDMDNLPGIEAFSFSNHDATQSLWEVSYWNTSVYFDLSLSFEMDYENVSTARFDLVDLYDDQLGDVVVIDEDGVLQLFQNQDNTYPFIDTVFFDTGISNSFNLRSGDVNNDGTEDMLIMDEGHIYVLWGEASVTAPPLISAEMFYDFDLDGLKDPDESDVPYGALNLNGLQTFYTNAMGVVSFTLPDGNYVLSAPLDSELLTWSTSQSYTFQLIEGMSDTTFYFGLIPNGQLVDSIDCILNSSSGICNSFTNHSIIARNEGNTVLGGQITYELDTEHSFINAAPSPTSILGNVYVWEYDNLFPLDQFSILIEVSATSSDDINSLVQNTATITATDETYNVTASDTDSDNYFVTCAYDPNDITEHNGYTEQGFVLDGDELEYTIRFQNTGNAPATNVRIENQLNDLLNRNTLQPIAWSNNFDLIIDETGKAIFTFPNINLPDSVSNEPESHGFVTYRIYPLLGLAPMTVIENTAEIYFDFNPAVVTNTEINNIYDCADLQQASVGESSVCSGEEILCGNNAIWIENLTWSFEGIDVGTGNYTHTVDESGTLTMHVSNALCVYTQDFELVAFNVEAIISWSEYILTATEAASYQWYLNGNEIPGATGQNYEITETGNYSVMIMDINGCDDVSDQVMATYTGVTERNELNLSVYPNPAREVLYISVPESLLGKDLIITNGLGQVVHNCGQAKSKLTEVICTDLAAGFYIVKIGNEKHSVILK